MEHGDAPPSRRELVELELEMREVRRSGRSLERDPYRCPWCGARTSGGACREHAVLERDYPQGGCG